VVVGKRVFGMAVHSVLGALRPAVVASAGVATILLPLRYFLATPLAAITLGGVVGTAVYVVLVVILAPDLVSRVRTLALAVG
jgi:hypothetical protein